MTCRVINLLAASPVSTLSLYFQHISYIFIYLLYFFTHRSVYIYTLVHRSHTTFPKLLNLPWLPPFFFHDQHGIMASIVVVFHFSRPYSAFFLICSLDMCAYVRELGMRMYVTARPGPLYVCVIHVSRCMCAGNRHACIDEALLWAVT